MNHSIGEGFAYHRWHILRDFYHKCRGWKDRHGTCYRYWKRGWR